MIEALSFVVAHSVPRFKCGIITTMWPAWWFAALACGLEPQWILPLGLLATVSCKPIMALVLNSDLQRADTVDILLMDTGGDDCENCMGYLPS